MIPTIPQLPLRIAGLTTASLLFCIAFATANASWRSAYYPENWTPPENANFYTDAFIQDFSYAGYHKGETPIPSTIPGVYVDVTHSPYNADPSGATSSTAAIQAAIDYVGSEGGGVVYLPPGTYRIEPGSRDYCLAIHHSNVVLRGAGPSNTRIFNDSSSMRQKAILRVIPGSGAGWNSNHTASMTNITADMMGPTRTIPVQSVSPFSVGDWIIVRNDMTDDWADEHQEPEWKARKDSLRGTTFCRQIVAIDTATNVIEIDVPLRYALKTRDNARVYLAPPMLEEVGIEHLAIGNRESTNTSGWTDPDGTLNNSAHSNAAFGAYQNHQSWLIDLTRLRNSWLRNVHSYQPTVNTGGGSHMLSNGILIEESRGVTLESVHMKRAQYGGGGGNGYAFRIQSNEILLTDCSAETFRHGFVISFMRASGIVIHRSLDADSRKCTGVTNTLLRTGSSGSDFHMWFSPSCLIDDMTLHNSLYRIVHRLGVSNDHNAVTAHSVVWNIRAMGNRFPLAVASSQTRYGYVIGTSGDRPSVSYVPPNGWSHPYDTDGVRSAPEDLVEGIGEGATLQPQSLYLDQLARRLGIENGGDPPPVGPENALTIASAIASDYQDPNIPENTLDNNLDTRWSAQGNGQWIEFSLEEPATLGQVWIAWFNGSERFFNFEIQTSLDGVAWTPVYADLSGSTSSPTNELQAYNIGESEAQYIRIIGNGNSVNDWNSITAVAFTAAQPAGLVRQWHFNTPGDVEGWTRAGSGHPNYVLVQATGIDGETGVLTMTGPLVEGFPDPQTVFTSSLSLAGFGAGYTEWDKIVFRARQISGTEPVAWSSSGTTALMANWGPAVGNFGPGIEGKAITAETQDEHWIRFTWDISSMGTGDLSNIRIDYVGNDANAGRNFEIDFIQLYAVEAEPVAPRPRPFIWVNDSDKPAILDKIANHSWADSLMSAMEARVADDLASHQADRDAYIRGLPVNWDLTPATYRTVPEYAENSVRGPTAQYFDTALECAVLYYLTGNTDYAALAGDVLHNAVRTLLPVTPSSEQSRGGWIFQNDFLKEVRVSGTQLPLIYDFLHDYLAENSVHDVQSEGLVPFSNAQAQLVFRTYYELSRDRGFMSHTNWHALMATSMLNNLLALDDVNEREAALEVYLVTGSPRQKSLEDDYVFYTEPGNVWPESLQYADAVTTIRASHLLMIERYDPSRNLLDTYPNFILGLPRVAELVYPNGQLIRFGDGRRTGSQPYFDYELAYQHALAKGRTDLTALFGPLINGGIEVGSHNRATLPSRPSLGQRNELLKLLWSAPEITEPAAPRVLPRTDRLPFAGISLQRNPSPNGDPAYGLMGFVGGAGYVHSHSSGMDMELYGLGHVLGAKGGRGTYQTTIHEKYYRNFAANNTIIVNGASRGMGGWANIGINTVQNVAMEPQQSAPPVSPDHSFSVSSFLDDKGTLAEATQQRTLALVRTSPTSGFYVDIFRSNSTVTNRTATTLDGDVTDQYHDYIYRNIGEPDFEVLVDGTPAVFSAQPNRFQNDIGDENEQPGWRYFENTRVTHPVDNAVRAQFVADIDGTEHNMSLHMPAIATREFAKVESPSISDAPAPYTSSKAPTLVVRQIGSAWDRPFVTVFEPHFGTDAGTVQTVTHLERDGVVCGVKVESLIDGIPAVHYIINHAEGDQTYEDPEIGLSFTGRFGIVADQGDGNIALYLGQGSSIAYGGGLLATSSGNTSQAEARFVPGVAPEITANTAVTVTEPILSSYQEASWRSHYFGTSAHTGDAAMTANPDGDAYDNWTEYVLGTDPTVPNFDPPLEIERTSDPLTLAFDTREATGPGYEGLSRYYTVEYSEDLWTWHELETARNIPGSGQRVVIDYPDGMESRRFFRLKVWLEEE